MAVQLSPSPRLFFGNLTSGYKLFTYAAGTTTKLVTYTD